MANVDLYGGDASAIRNAYRSNLRRDASDDEVSGWLSGSYGGGGVTDWVNQIANSHEARSHVVGPRPDENHAYPAPSGGSDPFYSDQPQQPQWPAGMPGGWGTPESGYGPGGVNNPAYTGWTDDSWLTGGNRIRDAYTQYLGRGASDDEVRNWLTGAFGYGAGGPSSVDTFVNAIRDISGYRAPTGTGPTGTTSPTTPYTGQTQAIPGDPYAWFMSLVNGKPSTPETLESLAGELAKYGIKIGSKGDRGWSDTIILPDGRTYDVIEGAGIGTGKKWQFTLNGGPGYVAGPSVPPNQYSDPYTKFLEQLLGGRIGSLMQPVNDPNRQMYEAMLKQRADALGRAEPQLNQLIGYLQKRFDELQTPGRTGAENEVVRTQALDPIERDRSAARQRMVERLSARGLSPDSGIAQQALLEVDKAFDEMRATSHNVLASNELNRREDRAQRAERVAGALHDIPEARSREQLDVFSALNELSAIARAEDEARQREAIGYGGALADLGPQRLQLAMQAAGMGGNPSSMFSNLMQLSGLNQNAALINQQNQGSWLNALGETMYYLSRAGI